jgi:histidyl-tRNA synthetase
LHGFDEYDAPVLESESLYVRKAGEEITDQLYAFEDKGGRRLALRPEMTPSLARMLISRPSFPLPLKWFSIPQCWRYERMTRGRRREHYQWNMDIFGVGGTAAEVELLAAIVCFLERVGLTAKDVQIKVSNRKVLEEVLQAAGVPADLFLPMCMLVDKADKIDEAELLKGMHELGVTNENTIERIMDMLQATDLTAIERLVQHGADGAAGGDDGESTAAAGGDAPATRQLGELLEGADAYGIGEWLSVDCSIVRGLSYYTGTVFEVRDTEGKFRAICGGGRYA